MDKRLMVEIKERQQKCRVEASKRGFDALMIIGQGPTKTGDMMYLANHCPSLPGHPRRYTFRGRGHSFLLLPLSGEPVLAVTTPFYEKDIAVQDVRFANNLIADLAAMEIKRVLRPGISELEVGKIICDTLSQNGVTGAFATCQSGERSKEPYPNDGMPCSDKVIEDGDMVHMEINGRYNGYQIDVCRSTVVGNMKKEQRIILELCAEMLEESIAATRAGIYAEELELVTGEIALKHGLGANHTATYGGPGTYLGHAIGLSVDEPPCLAKGDKTILVPGMILTIEPGIYRTEWGGCRIEDEVLVTETGFEVLNQYGRRLWEK